VRIGLFHVAGWKEIKDVFALGDCFGNAAKRQLQESTKILKYKIGIVRIT
jgi:hypothetical protein